MNTNAMSALTEFSHQFSCNASHTIDTQARKMSRRRSNAFSQAPNSEGVRRTYYHIKKRVHFSKPVRLFNKIEYSVL